MPDPTFDALPDPADFRDQLFVPTLVEVPTRIDLATYRAVGAPILDQKTEGACTGFGLATVCNYLLRRRKVEPELTEVSPRMLYEMARRYDEWEGEEYAGSSARGAMKGWHKHGVCSGLLAPYVANESGWLLEDDRAQDAVRRPLGAYYRVNPKDLVSMHAALAEVGILYATSRVHTGWLDPAADGLIQPEAKSIGGHAFAIVAYDADGLWIQNSWGKDWGLEGFGRVSYDDWLEHSMDVWVARLGAPVRLRTAQAAAVAVSTAGMKSRAYAACDVRPHVVSVGNEGLLSGKGTYGTLRGDVERLFRNDFPRLTEGWDKRRLVLYAHGGLTSEESAIERVMDYRPAMIENCAYPVAFVWKTDYWTTLQNILSDAARRRRPEGMIESAKDFLLDRLDDGLEPLARLLTGKLQWDEMKENAVRASTHERGAARLAAAEVAALAKSHPDLEIHLVGHSAGSIFLGPLVSLLTSTGTIENGVMRGDEGLGLTITSCTLWAPACTVDHFLDHYAPSIAAGGVQRFALYTLTDRAERDDDCADLYHKSLLYLVSNAFEAKPRIPGFRDGVPILGMEKFLDDERLEDILAAPNVDWVTAPNDAGPGSKNASQAQSHGAFDDDELTVRSTLKRILDGGPNAAQFRFAAGAGTRRAARRALSARAAR